MFAMIYQTEHGDTVTVDDPKLQAYSQAAYIRLALGRSYRMTARDDGSYTVEADGVAPITFTKGSN